MMTVLDSNSCLGVRLLGIVGWACSTILTAGAVDQRNMGKDVVMLESHSLWGKSEWLYNVTTSLPILL